MSQVVLVTHSLQEILFTNTHEIVKCFTDAGYEVHIIATLMPQEREFERQIPTAQFHYAGTGTIPSLEHISLGLYEHYKMLDIERDTPIFFPQNYYAKYFVLDTELNQQSFIDVVDVAWDEIAWMVREHLWFSPDNILGVITMFGQKGLFQDIIHRSAAHLITPSTLTCDDVKRHYGKDSVIIPFNIRNADFGSPVKSQFSGEVLYFGRIDPRKGMGILIRGLKTLLADPQLFIRIAGRSNVPTTYVNYLRKIQNARVKFYGVCDSEQRRELFRNADLCLVPSTYDPYPRTVLEALAAGIPVLASTAVGSAVDLHTGQPKDGIFLFKNDDGADFTHQLSRALEYLKGLGMDEFREVRLRCVERSQQFTPMVRAKRLLDLFFNHAQK